MHKLRLLLFLAVLPLIMVAQDAKKEEKNEKAITVKLGGFVRNDMSFNTRQVVSAREESNFILFPKDVSLDSDGKDINEAPNFNMTCITSRLNTKITGPDAFGAKSSAFMEIDMLGIGKTMGFYVRLRHAFLKLDWESTKLLAGQYWHPMFAVDAYPGTLSFSTGVPFNPLSRNAQVRLTQKFGNFSIMGAIMSQGNFQGKGAGKLALQNGVIPEAHLQAQFKNKIISTGVGVNFESIRPNLYSQVVDTNGITQKYIDDTRVNGLSFFGFLKAKTAPLTLKTYLMYGQNNDNLVMMGGYAIVDKIYSEEQMSKGFVEYAPYNTFTSWLDLETNGKRMKIGLFGGYALNLGASEKVIPNTFVGNWNNIESMYRVASRVKFFSKNVMIGLEVEYMGVNYVRDIVDSSGNILSGTDPKGVITRTEEVNNIQVLCAIAYKF
jgi:hypothetical protein